jgi:hypothetical protein
MKLTFIDRDNVSYLDFKSFVIYLHLAMSFDEEIHFFLIVVFVPVCGFVGSKHRAAEYQ